MYPTPGAKLNFGERDIPGYDLVPLYFVGDKSGTGGDWSVGREKGITHTRAVSWWL